MQEPNKKHHITIGTLVLVLLFVQCNSVRNFSDSDNIVPDFYDEKLNDGVSGQKGHAMRLSSQCDVLMRR